MCPGDSAFVEVIPDEDEKSATWVGDWNGGGGDVLTATVQVHG